MLRIVSTIYGPAVRETLESRGVLQQLKAQARAGVFSALDNQQVQLLAPSQAQLTAASLSHTHTHTESWCVQREERRELPEETMVINKLIKDYLQFNGYNYTRSVFVAGQQIILYCTAAIVLQHCVSMKSLATFSRDGHGRPHHSMWL